MNIMGVLISPSGEQQSSANSRPKTHYYTAERNEQEELLAVDHSECSALEKGSIMGL